MPERCLIAMGGGGFSMEPENPALDEYILSRARSPRPKVCFLPTASGDSDQYVVRFYGAFGGRDRCVATHLPLFKRQVQNLTSFLLDQDVVYVGGGNTLNMLAIWRAHGLDKALRKAWEAGVVLCGISAGALCWFEGGVTDSFGSGLRPLADGLGFIPGSVCPHYDGEAERRPTFHRTILAREIPEGVAADDGVAIRYEGIDLVEVVSSRPAGRAWRVTRSPSGSEVVEAELRPRFLG